VRPRETSRTDRPTEESSMDAMGMPAPPARGARARVPALLIRDLAAVDRLVAERAPARRRLVDSVGLERAALFLRAARAAHPVG
jgi:hypothetical protein